MSNYSEPLANGLYQIHTPPNPAPGANLSVLLANGFTYEIVSIRFTLTADANVANRFIRIAFTDAANTYAIITHGTAFTAGLVGSFDFMPGLNGHTAAVNLNYMGPLPINWIIPGNFTISTSIQNIQVGDQISTVDIAWRKWINQTV